MLFVLGMLFCWITLASWRALNRASSDHTKCADTWKERCSWIRWMRLLGTFSECGISLSQICPAIRCVLWTVDTKVSQLVRWSKKPTFCHGNRGLRRIWFVFDRIFPKLLGLLLPGYDVFAALHSISDIRHSAKFHLRRSIEAFPKSGDDLAQFLRSKLVVSECRLLFLNTYWCIF